MEADMLFSNVVVGVDEHAAGRDAIALAKLLLAPRGKLSLAHVYGGDMASLHRSNAGHDTAERERALELLANVRDQVGIDAKLRAVGATSVGRGLHVLAEASEADLLVVGSSRRGLLGRVLLGDDTRAALNGAPCAVAVAPAAYAAHPKLVREVGVGYNGTPESDYALAVARELASKCGARLSAFEAVSLPTYLFLGGPAPINEPIEEFVETARERIAALGGVEPHAAYGNPAEELTLYGASLDLLVIGSRSYGPIGRLMHGSTSQQLARSSRCPLLVLPRVAPLIGASGNSHERERVAAR
jgi:nucleotide-binding universal stress UspA family protein